MSNSAVTHRTTESKANLSEAVVEAVADREGTDPTTLSPPLHSVIDADALNALFHAPSAGDADSEGSVRFTYCGYEVCVHSDGTVGIADSAGHPEE